MADGNGKATNGSGPATSGKAYPIEDHTYDVVVVGAGGAGLRAVVDMLHGETTPRMRQLGLVSLSTHGLFSREDPEWILRLLRRCNKACICPDPAGLTPRRSCPRLQAPAINVSFSTA